MAVTSDKIWYPYGGEQPAYDLSKVERWALVPTNEDQVRVVFVSSAVGQIDFDKDDFETAYQAWLDTL